MARYFVYDKSNQNRIVARAAGQQSYATAGAAQAAITRASKKYQQNPDNLMKLDQDPQFIYAIAETEHYYSNLERMVTRTNLMSGKEYQESINTPSYCSPSSEAYWSM